MITVLRIRIGFNEDLDTDPDPAFFFNKDLFGTDPDQNGVLEEIPRS
jgi:hypothetical protein